MHAASDRPEFTPPPQPGMLRAFGLAVVAHLLLVLALTQGLQWQRTSQDAAVEAELWSALPQQAAPREVVAPPPPPPPVVKAPPQPEPPVVKPAPPPEAAAPRDADIALEREKQKRDLDKRKQAQLEREREQRRRQEAAVRKREEELAQKKQEQASLLAEAKRKEAENRKKLQEQEARETRRVAQLREENMRRMQGMAGTGAPDSGGGAPRASGPSEGWGARVIARVRPNIVFADTVPGNPEALVEVRLAPDGTIVSRRISKSSGHAGWDQAVLRALDRTEVLPRDVDGRVPSNGTLVFRPRQ